MHLNTLRTALRVSALTAIAAALVFSGCKEREKAAPPPPEQAEKPATPVQQPPRQVETARVDPECAAPVDLAPPQELKLGTRTATRTGYKLSFTDKDADGELVMGVLGPLNEDTGQNLLAVRKYLKFFQDQKADAILVPGDIGETEEGIARVLEEIGKAGLPTFLMIGNRECRADFTNGVLAAQKNHPHLVNLNQVRMVEFAEATLVSLPGYHNDTYLHCRQGCLYDRSTVDEAIRVAKEARSPAVLLSHGPPRGEGSQALDFATSGGNIGDAEVNRALQEGNIPFGVFSNVKEAGARAVDTAEGASLVAQGKSSRRLYLNPGPADTEAWKMNDGTESAGMAAVLRIKDGEASWKLFQARPLSASEKAQAQALNPSR